MKRRLALTVAAGALVMSVLTSALPAAADPAAAYVWDGRLAGSYTPTAYVWDGRLAASYTPTAADTPTSVYAWDGRLAG